MLVLCVNGLYEYAMFDAVYIMCCVCVADEYENGSCFQSGGIGTICYEESFYCVFLVEASQHSQA